MSEEQTIEIATYDLGHFPETQEESTEEGEAKVAKQFIAVKKLIAGAFQDVFHKNWEESFMEDCRYHTVDEKEVILYKNRPFIELGEMTEDFTMKNGTQHIVINQSYRVL